MQGLTLDDLCAPMPIVNTVKAVEELKNSDISNDALQNCCVPAIIGGEVGVILGIRYNNIRPKEVHSLESGLTIYSINLETHDPTHNAAIGGPHKSFTALLNRNGGIARVSQTLQILHAQLDNFRKYGPPKIPHIPMNKSVFEHSTDILHDKAYQHSDELNENSDGDVDPSVYDPVGLKGSAQQQFYQIFVAYYDILQ